MAVAVLPIFVYGTLRRGEKNYPLYLEPHIERVIPARASGCLYFIEKEGYPYMLPGEGSVVGDLVIIRTAKFEEVVSSLDRLEDYDSGNERESLYLRRTGHVQTGDGETLAWIYYWNGPRRGRKVESGDFKSLRVKP